MLTVALQWAGLDPSFAIGGELNESGSGAHHGSGDIFVAEADESDGSFLALSPHGAIITNLEPDHLDHHGTAAAYTAVFRQFVDRVAAGGFLVLCLDDPGTRALLAAEQRRPGSPRVITYGFDPRADVRISDHRSRRPRRHRGGPTDRSGHERWGSGAVAASGGAGRAHAVQRRPPRWPPASRWVYRPPPWPTVWPDTPGSGVASNTRAEPPACRSTTTMPTTRPRSPPS